VLFELPASDAPLTARECTRLYSTLAWSCDQIFLVAAGWVDGVAAPRRKAAVAVTARVFGWQAAQWRALVPESVLLEDDRSAAPAASARAAIDALRASDAAQRVESLRALVVAMADEVGLLTARLSPVSDGAAVRLAEFLRADLARATTTLEG
jgi:hypothetical protein